MVNLLMHFVNSSPCLHSAWGRTVDLARSVELASGAFLTCVYAASKEATHPRRLLTDEH
jgi:hypothetical protein